MVMSLQEMNLDKKKKSSSLGIYKIYHRYGFGPLKKIATGRYHYHGFNNEEPET